MLLDTNIRGILLMIAAMAAFSAADSLVKLATDALSTGQVMFYLSFGALLIFSALAVRQGNKLSDPRAFTPILLVRYAAEIVGMIGMVTALNKVDISTVGAITQATPILAAVGAVLFLRERVGWRRWAAIIVGFCGVLLIVQPGATAFDIDVLWALLALAALSIRDLTTRMTPKDMPSASLATYTMAATVPVMFIWVLLSAESFLPAQASLFIILPMVVMGSLGYLLLIASLRMAEVSVVMPFRYTRIIFLLAVGVIVFGEQPDRWTIFGAGLIMASGIYMMWREKQVQQSSK